MLSRICLQAFSLLSLPLHTLRTLLKDWQSGEKRVLGSVTMLYPTLVEPGAKGKINNTNYVLFKILVVCSSWIFGINVDFLNIALKYHLSWLLRFLVSPKFCTQGKWLTGLIHLTLVLALLSEKNKTKQNGVTDISDFPKFSKLQWT